MKFLPKEICQKLVELGCKSESGFHYIKRQLLGAATESTWMAGVNYGDPKRQWNCTESVKAFTPYDFLGDSEQVIENCKILWGDAEKIDPHDIRCIWASSYIFNRHELLDAPDQVSYIVKAVEERVK